jgi:hypothetical protein
MTNDAHGPATQENSVGLDGVPADFPLPVRGTAISGAQPKLALVEHEGKFYSPGCTPPEIRARWAYCEDLAQQFAEKAAESKSGKRAHLSEQDVLDQYLPRLVATGWTSEPEARFVIRRAAAILQWPVPPAATA